MHHVCTGIVSLFFLLEIAKKYCFVSKREFIIKLSAPSCVNCKPKSAIELAYCKKFLKLDTPLSLRYHPLTFFLLK